MYKAYLLLRYVMQVRGRSGMNTAAKSKGKKNKADNEAKLSITLIYHIM